MTNSYNWPRRSQLKEMIPAEIMIREAIAAVEYAGAHPLLTEAVILLGQAQSKVADWYDAGVSNKSMTETKPCCDRCFFKTQSGLTHCLDIFNCPCHQQSDKEGVKLCVHNVPRYIWNRCHQQSEKITTFTLENGDELRVFGDALFQIKHTTPPPVSEWRERGERKPENKMAEIFNRLKEIHEPRRDWEEELLEYWNSDAPDDSGYLNIKSLIRTLLSQEREKVEKIVEKLRLHPLYNIHTSYNVVLDQVLAALRK